MKWNKEKINLILIALIIINYFFFAFVDYKIDYILMIALYFVNIKDIINYFKNNKIILILGLIIVVFFIAQYFYLYYQDFSIIKFIYNVSYNTATTLLPFVFLICIKPLKFSPKDKSTLDKVIVISVLAMLAYGFINYIFDFNLNRAGMYVLSNPCGRVQSFLLNPNNYGFLIVVLLIIVLFNFKMKAIYKWILTVLFVSSICITYGRYNYFLMALAILAFIVYVIVKKKGILNIGLITLVILASFYLPNNNYLYISLTNEFDSMGHTNITEPIYKIIDKIVLIDYDTPSKKLHENLHNSELNKLSSANTRVLFKDIAIKIYKENKIFGIGRENYHNAMKDELIKMDIDYVDSELPHNYYVLVLASYGLLGFILFIALTIYIFIKLIKTKSITPVIIYSIYLINNFMTDYIIKTGFLCILIAFVIKNKNNEKSVK